MKKYYRIASVFLVAAVVMASQFGQSFAQSNAITISPRKDYALKPGDSVTDTLSIANQNREEALNLSLEIVDFSAKDENGTPQLLRDQAEPTPWSIKSFVDLPDQVSIGPGESAKVPVTVSIPSGTGAGSYYGAVQYSAVNPTTGEQVNIAASTVTLMFVDVPGKAVEQLDFEQFGAFVPDSSGRDGSFAGLFFNERPRVLAYRLTNNGNVAEEPSATIIVKNNSGETVYTIADANPKNQIALRGQTRRFDACIFPETVVNTTDSGLEVNAIECGDPDLAPGRYTAELTVLYGQNGNETREITARATFWYLPWWFIGVVVAGLLIVVGAVVYIVRRVKDVRSRKTRR